VRRLLIVLTMLMIWGPPRLRITQRPLEAALTSPLDLDAAGMFQAAVWVCGGAVVLLMLASFAIRYRRFAPAVLWTTSLKYYLAYGLFALASSTYSASPFYTLFAAGKIVVAILAVVLLTDRGSLLSPRPLALTLFFLVNILQWLANSMLYFFYPSLVGSELPGIGYRLYGGIFEDYGAAAVCAGLYFQSQAMFYTRGHARFWNWTLYSATWFFVILSRTRSAILGAVASFAVMVLLYRRTNTRVLAVVGIVAAIGIFLVMGGLDPATQFAMRGQDLSTLETLTGRSQAFSYLVEQWKESPWLGFGYGAGSRYLLIEFVRNSGLGIGSAHDAMSRVLADLGLVGTAMMVSIFLTAWRDVVLLVRSTMADVRAHALALQLAALLTFFTFTSVVSSGIAEASFPFLITSVGVAVARRHHLASGLSEAQAGGVWRAADAESLPFVA
jgi:O-antigen ligase